MDIALKYGNMVRRNIDRDTSDAAAKAAKQIRLGLQLESFRVAHLSDKRMPDAYQFLNHQGISLVAQALGKPETLAYTNIFAPVEILQCFGLTCVSMECLSSYLSGFYLENTLIDRAESAGISPTLCSYHRNFLGAVDAGVLPKARIGVTTSMVCDGNICSFRRLEEEHGVPSYVIDIPHTWSPDARDYVTGQLRELISLLEAQTGRKLDMDELKSRLESENRAKVHYRSFLRKRMTRSFPNTLTLIVFQLFASHLDIGMPWAEEFFRRMDEEIDHYPLSDEKRILWIHIPPFAQPALRDYFNYGDRITLIGDDFDQDFMEELDTEHPLEALAGKMIRNIYNGDFTRKTDAVAKMVQEYKPDGVIEFCTWGCRQSAGGVQLMRRKMQELGMPMLVLDGDAIDRRSTPDGQIRTRLEAFLEELGVPSLAEVPAKKCPGKDSGPVWHANIHKADGNTSAAQEEHT